EEERLATGANLGAVLSEPEMLTRRAASSRQTQVARDLSVDDVSRVAEMALPLVGSDELLGVLSVRSDRASDFDDRGRKVLERFAVNLVMAIQNARLYEAERGRSRRLEILGALQSDAGPMGSPADMVRRAARAITDAYPEIDVWITGVADVALREFPSGPPVGSTATDAEIDLAIRKGDRELGVLHLRHRTAAAFPEEERRTFALLADRLAIALENAALFSQIEVERREWERTFDAIPDMLSIHDGYGRMLRGNQSLQVRLGGEIRPFLGRDCADLLETVVGKAGGCPHMEALQARRALAREIQGERGVFTLMAIPCFDETGDCLYIIHICREITEEKQIREQLLHNEKMAAVGSLVSGVAHELNNPLAGVTGFAQLLLERSVDPKLNKTLERIRDEAERAAKIVKNLLTFARKHKPESARISINSILERTLELRAYDMRVNDIKVTAALDPNLPPTLADPNQLQQVFLNVIVNAEHAMKDAHAKGQFSVTTSVVDGKIRITMVDDGPGIKPEVLKQIFDPFFTTKTVGQGTGLGLSICKAIIREHGGTIGAASTVGQGTTFTIDLPVVAGKETKVEMRRKAPLPLSPSTILVVDDELSMRELIRDALTARGHTVDAVENGLLALQAINSRRYDLVVSDLKMPGMSGQELFARLRSDAPDLIARIIFTSGDSVSPETRNFLESSGRPYLLKPFEVNDMVEEAEKVAAGKGPPPRNLN
ncbi:MAG TPA: ATP-binding protein, partial [Candidatus Polarisedimenticolia bacterium]